MKIARLLTIAALLGFAAPAVAQTTPQATPQATPPAASKSAPSTPTKPATATPPAASSSMSKTQLLDINTASADELKALPGISDTYSAKIIAGRPYKLKSQLVSKKILPQKTYDGIKDQIVAKQ